jgi:hypothetical protein
MANRGFWSVSALAMSASTVLASCGGDILAAVAFIGSAGGDWRLDSGSEPGLQPSNCDGSSCQVNIQLANVNEPLFTSDFNVTYTSTLPDCPDSGTGRIEGKRVSLTGCLAGEYVSVNEVRTDSGQRFLFETFVPDFTTGIWVEIEDERRRFKFVAATTDVNDDTVSIVTGCELTTPAVTPAAMRVVRATFLLDPPPDPFTTRIEQFVIGTTQPWTGRFIGISGLEYRRGNEVLKLERRRDADPPTAC